MLSALQWSFDALVLIVGRWQVASADFLITSSFAVCPGLRLIVYTKHCELNIEL